MRRAGASTVELDDNVAVYDDVGQLLILLNTERGGGLGALRRHDDGRRHGARRLAAAHPDDAAVIGEDVRQTVRKLVELGLVVDGGPA